MTLRADLTATIERRTVLTRSVDASLSKLAQIKARAALTPLYNETKEDKIFLTPERFVELVEKNIKFKELSLYAAAVEEKERPVTTFSDEDSLQLAKTELEKYQDLDSIKKEN